MGSGHLSRLNETRANDWLGLILIVISGAGFATLAIFGKLAFAAGMSLPTTLTLRFAGAALLFTLLTGLRSLALMRAQPNPAALSEPKVTRANILYLLLLGGVGYTGQSALYLGAAMLIPAALTGMLLYTYPAWVTLLAWWLDGDRPDGRRWLALGLALVGTTLIAGEPGGALNPLGVVLAIASGMWYSAYIVFGARATKGVPALVSSMWVAVGALVIFAPIALALGQFSLAFAQPSGWYAIGGMILFATVIPVAAFLGGLQRLGPARSAILSTFEPVFTVALSVALLGERLTPAQALGSALIIFTVILLQLRSVPR